MSSETKPERPYEYYGTVTNVVDGDTVDVMLDLGLHIHHSIRLRLFGLNAPELRGPEKAAGKETKAWLEKQVLSQPVKVETIRDKTGKYGRLLAIIHKWGRKNRWVEVNELMVEEGMAVEYMR